MRAVKRALYDLKTIVAQHPSLALPAARWRRHGDPLAPDTEILVEGYPRSANTFAVVAFRTAQQRPIRIAHHLHAPGHVMAAVRANVPALVLIREPQEAVLEFVIRNPGLTIRQAMRGYLRFYGPLLPYRGRFVVGPFGEVTTDFGTVIRRVNDRFGTSFREFEHSEQNVRACFRAIEADYAKQVGAGRRFETIVARPSALREQIKDDLREAYRADTLSTLRADVDSMHETFRASSA